MCGCLGSLFLIGAVLYLWDGLWHGFGDATGLALVVLAVGAISIFGWLVKARR